MVIEEDEDSKNDDSNKDDGQDDGDGDDVEVRGDGGRGEYMMLTTVLVNNVKTQTRKRRKKRNQMIVKSILVYVMAIMGKGRILMKTMNRRIMMKSQKMRTQLMRNSNTLN
jgi:hypothetical protein